MVEEYPTRSVQAWVRHPWAGLAALVSSILLHWALLRWDPSFPIAPVRTIHATWRFKPVVMERVDREPVSAQTRKASTIPSWPAVLLPAPHPPKPAAFTPEKREEVNAEWRAGPERDYVVQGDSSAGAVQFEQILRVMEPLHDERVSALPRRLEEEVPRYKDTSDFKLPVVFLEKPAGANILFAMHHDNVISSAGSGPLVDSPGLWTEGVESEMVTAKAPEMPEERPATNAQPLDEFLALDVRAFRAADEQTIYFEMKVRPLTEDLLPVLPRDILFVQDVSESMTQRKVDACREGWMRWLNTLDERDRFDILEFRDDVRACFGQWKEVNAVSRAQARTFVGEMISRGNTDILRSLEAVFRWSVSERRPVLVVLASDGRPTAGVVDTSTIITRFTEQNGGERSIFCISGGQRVNRFFMDLLSFANRGDHWTDIRTEAIPSVMERTATELKRPVLAGLRIRATGTVGANLYPVQPSHLYLDRALVLYGKTDAQEPSFAVQIVGWSADAICDMVFPIDLTRAVSGSSAIREGWARQRIYALLQEFVKTRSSELLVHLRDVANRYGIVLPYALEAP